MMTILIVFAAAAQAYLLGSIDTGILVSKYLYHDDVRNYGSGAAGMTNMLRTFGKKSRSPDRCGRCAQGRGGGLHRPVAVWLPARKRSRFALPRRLSDRHPGRGRSPEASLLWLQGWQGCAGGGWCHSGHPAILLPFLAAIFLLCLLPTGMVSLGSIVMAASYPVLTLLYGLLKGLAVGDLVVCVTGAAIMGGMVVYMHRANIQRIRAGQEYRFGRKHKNKKT